MAALSYTTRVADPVSRVSGESAPSFTRAAEVRPVWLSREFRFGPGVAGEWTDRVMFKADAGAPEQPFATALVWVLRLSDGFLAWAGFSDANGYYTATKLEPGADYVALGIDPRIAANIAPGQPGKFKAVGAGPFTVPAA